MRILLIFIAFAIVLYAGFSLILDMGKRLYPVLPARLVTRINYPVREYITAVPALDDFLDSVLGPPGRTPLIVASD